MQQENTGANALIHETSPYLLQHAYNPVEWHPWGPEALQLAKQTDKPIIVSIGYSTCHWCHVMERESFEDKDTADFMNAHFICIKIDREERPDLDQIYMDACQIMTGSGGWPLNCFLTTDALPFYAGTYFPPMPAHQRPSWMQVLRNLHNAWLAQRKVVEEQAKRLQGYIQDGEQNMLLKAKEATEQLGFDPRLQGGRPFHSAWTEEVFYKLRERFDRQDGGFGYAPKFPSLMAIRWLLEYAHFRNNDEALLHAVFSLERMVTGGIYDQLAGGLARYSTDTMWLAPHFEKMLYDNALFVTALSDAIRMIETSTQIRKKPLGHLSYSLELFKSTLHETMSFCLRQMSDSASGAWYSAIDADSEGEEGKYYVWTKAEVEALLDPQDATYFCAWFDVSAEGNWEGVNILRQVYTPVEFEAKHKGGEQWVKEHLPKAKQKLLDYRGTRIAPGLDDKSITAWCGLMISACIAAYRATANERYLEQAANGLEFIQHELMVKGTSKLYHTWKDGKAKGEGLLDDYAFIIAASLDVFEGTGHTVWAKQAESLAKEVLNAFVQDGPLFQYAPLAQTDLVVRKVDYYDNALPSANSVLAGSLIRLGHLFENRTWLELGESMLIHMRPLVQQYPLSFGMWGLFMQREAHDLIELQVAGPESAEWAIVIQRAYLPNTVLAWCSSGENLSILSDKQNLTETLIYQCRNFTCGLPQKSALAAIKEVLHDLES